MNVKSILLSTILSLFSVSVYAQESLLLSTISVEDSLFSNHVKSDFILNHSLILNSGRLSYQNYTSSDIIIDYNGLKLNDNTDGRANLRFFPSVLTENISDGIILNSYAPSLSLNDSLNDREFTFGAGSDLSLSTLFKSDLGGKNYIFYDMGYGIFPFKDEQGTFHTRQNNESDKYGIIINQTQNFSELILNELAIVSHYDRSEPGLSEFPQYYSLANESGTLVGLLFSLGWFRDNHSVDSSVSFRFQKMFYENESSRLSNLDRMDYSDLSLMFNFTYGYKDFTVLLDNDLQYQSTYDKYRDITSISFLGSIAKSNYSFDYSIGIITDFDKVLFPISLKYSLNILGYLGLNFEFNHRSRFPTYSELYFVSEFIRGDQSLLPQISDSVSSEFEFDMTYLKFKWFALVGFHRNMIRYIAVTPTLFKVYNLEPYFMLTAGVDTVLDFENVRFDFKYIYTHAPYDSYIVPLVSSHMISSCLSLEYGDFDIRLSYSYKSPYYVNFSNTVSIQSDHDLELSTIYSWRDFKLDVSFSNLLFQRRETALQKPLPLFYATVKFIWLY